MQVVDTVITDWQVQCSAVEQNNFQDLHPAIQNTTNPQITHKNSSISMNYNFNQQNCFATLA